MSLQVASSAHDLGDLIVVYTFEAVINSSLIS